MATLRTSHACGGFLGGGKGSIGQSRGRSSVKVQGCKKHLSWRLEPEVIWYRYGSLKPKKFSCFHLLVTAASTNDLQNADLPPVLPKRKKRPGVLPKRSKRRAPVVWEDPSLRPPGNGLLVEDLVPVAHDVMEAKAIAFKGVRLLLKQIPVVACRFCSEPYIGSIGHTLRSCQGPKSANRNSLHDWVKGTIEDILVPIEAYHLADRLNAPISHEQRFDVDRISAIEELCIQAGVDVPEYPTNRYSEAVIPLTRKRREDASWAGGVEFTYYTASGSYQLPSKGKRLRDVSRVGAEDASYNRIDNAREHQITKSESFVGQTNETERLRENSMTSSGEVIIPLVDISSEDDLETVAQKTLQAWERMREGAKKLMTKYRVLACGYCPEVHVGPRGHRGRVCGAFKHQWRDGKHGWQDASLDDLIPPQYVWHVRDRFGPPLENALRRFYGQAPALVELCVQAGAAVPDIYRPAMRLDVAIPTVDEADNVF